MTSTTLVASALSALVIFSAQSDKTVALADQDAVMQLRLDVEHSETVASAVLVHRDDGPDGVVLYFLTSESLVRPASGALEPWTPESEGDMAGQSPAPSIAVLRMLTDKSALVPARVTLDSPRPGELFFIVSHDAAGARVLVPQHIGVISERYATGDVDMLTPACAGAPALSEKGVFGIVCDCENRPPLVILLSAARPLLLRLIPGLDVGR